MYLDEPNPKAFIKYSNTMDDVYNNINDYSPKISTAQKMKISIKDFCSKCDQIRSLLRIWRNLLKKSLAEYF